MRSQGFNITPQSGSGPRGHRLIDILLDFILRNVKGSHNLPIFLAHQ
jgi:hypothetical protein